jgi:hypothetical protein
MCGDLDSGFSDQGLRYRGHVEQRLYAHETGNRTYQIHSLEYPDIFYILFVPLNQ